MRQKKTRQLSLSSGTTMPTIKKWPPGPKRFLYGMERRIQQVPLLPSSTQSKLTPLCPFFSKIKPVLVGWSTMSALRSPSAIECDEECR